MILPKSKMVWLVGGWVGIGCINFVDRRLVGCSGTTLLGHIYMMHGTERLLIN
jgi:hypothetical protein